jgi:hypothetical protein
MEPASARWTYLFGILAICIVLLLVFVHLLVEQRQATLGDPTPYIGVTQKTFFVQASFIGMTSRRSKRNA